MTLIDYRWYWSKLVSSAYKNASGWISFKNITAISWAVLIWNWYNFRAFIWIWTSWDEDMDLQEIAAMWNSISKSEAVWIFGDVAIDIDKKKYTIDEYYI